MTGRALIVFAFQKGYAIAYQAKVALHEYIMDAGGELDCFDLEKIGADYAKHEDGLYVAELKLIDDGPGDYPGSREVCVSVVESRLATKEEWEAHRTGEWPWESLL